MTNKTAARRKQRPNLHAHPVAVAVATTRMRSHLRTVGIEVFMTQEGEQATGLLSHLCWIVGLGAEISANVAPGSEPARRQHMALRNLVHMAAQGCHWRAALAEPIWEAALEANDLLIKHPSTGQAMVPAADYLAARVKSGLVSMSDIAGAEIYRAKATTEQQA